MSVPRLHRSRACRKDASAKPPPTMRGDTRLSITSFLVLFGIILLPQTVWAAEALADPSATSVLLISLWQLS